MKRKMSRLNEELIRKSNLDIPDGPVKVDGATNPVYTDALNQHAKREKEVADMLKDANKVADIDTPFTGSTDKKNMPKKVEEAKMVLDESLFEDIDLDDPNSDYYAVSRYLDDAIPDICRDTVDAIENMTEQEISRLADKCRSFYDYLESKLSSKMTEAYEYEGADQMGRAQCSPLVPDFSKSIKDYVKHYGEDSRYDNVILSALQSYFEKLADSKQEVENFNAYWSERYPLLIKYIDDQLAIIPQDLIKIISITDDIIEEDLHEDTENQLYYKRKREPLADIIQDELTFGEICYRKSGDKFTPTQAPSLNIDAEEIGVDEDENGDFIIAWTNSPEKAAEVASVGKKYGKDTKSGEDRFAEGKNKFFTKIYLDLEDWEEPYFDPNVKTR